MLTTTTQFGPDFVKELIPWFLKMIEDSTKKAYRIIWDAFIPYVWQHWLAILVILILILIVSFARAIFTGRWAVFGSVLYNYFYFGTLFIIGLIFGPELFVNDYFQIFLVILYVVCFLLVGKILRKTGLKRY